MKANQNCILLVFEGETESIFYRKIRDIYLNDRKIRVRGRNMYGQSNITEKALEFIDNFLVENPGEKYIHVFIIHDREGSMEKESLLDLKHLKRIYFRRKVRRIASLHEIIATQDLESWFFADIDGIYNFLHVPPKKRNYRKYRNIEATNNRVLSALFLKYGQVYSKGVDSENLINSLDIDKIVHSVKELNEAVDLMIQLKSR